MFWFWMMMRNPPECPPLKFEGSGSAQDNFLPSMDIHGALYVHSWDCAVCTAGTVHCMCIVHCWDCAFYVHCALFTAHITLERHYTVHNKCTSVTIFSFLSPQLYADALCISALFLYSAHFSQIESTENHSAEWKRVKILQTKVKESSSQSSLLSSFLIN